MSKGKIKPSRFLRELVADLDTAWQALPVSGVQLDSRKVQAGDLFIACPGDACDGRDFINEAISFGASAVLAERDQHWAEDRIYQGVPVIMVANLRQQVSEIAGRFYQQPSKQLPVVGITGTNGKTSCSHMVAQVLQHLNQRCAVVGTLGSGYPEQLSPTINTTPDAVSLQAMLSQWSQQDADMVAMEVSSHGLAQHRVDGIHFLAAVFTNLSRDHLDYHGDMNSYLASKQKLFQHPELRFVAINYDDEHAADFADQVGPDTRIYYYSLQDAAAEVYAERIESVRDGIHCVVVSPWGQGKLQLPLLGRFNLLNALAVITILAANGYAFADILLALGKLQPIAGRMQRVDVASDIDVVVDYAHTPDALSVALDSLQQHSGGAIWCVFGCGGERDRGKRAQMGQVAAAKAQHLVLTDDNPRREDPQQILDDILQGIDTLEVVIERCRDKAIQYAIDTAEAGDSVLIAGKGHEDYQLIGEEKHDFSDYDFATAALARRAGR